MRNYFKIFFILLFFLTGKSSLAQVSLRATIDTSKIRIGEPVKLDLYLIYNSNSGIKSIEWPTIGDTITEKIEVLSTTPIDTTMPDKNDPGMLQQHQQLTISVYDSGYYAIPPFKFIINGDTANPGYTEPLLLEVHTVPTDSSAKKIKDIKEPFNEPFSWLWYKEYFYWGIAFIVFVVALLIFIHYRNKRHRNKILEPEKPKIPAHITALASLERIREQQIWKEDKVKEYYSEITDTIRLYIEERYNVSALESTTDELLQIMKTQVIDTVSGEKLQQMLKLADFVKFAKMIPLEQEHALVLQHAFDIVNGTKREDEIVIIEQSTDTVSQSGAGVGGAGTNTTSQNIEQRDLHQTEKISKIEDQEVKSKKGSGKGKILVILGSLGGVLLIVLLWYFLYGSTEAKLKEMSSVMNSRCPAMIDQETRLDGTEIIGDNTIKYIYTLINMSKDQIDREAFVTQIEPGIIDLIKTNPQLQPLREMRVVFQYYYKDKSGRPIAVINVSPEQYEQ